MAVTAVLATARGWAQSPDVCPRRCTWGDIAAAASALASLTAAAACFSASSAAAAASSETAEPASSSGTRLSYDVSSASAEAVSSGCAGVCGPAIGWSPNARVTVLTASVSSPGITQNVLLSLLAKCGSVSRYL